MKTSTFKSKQGISIWNAITRFIVNLHSFFPANAIFGCKGKFQILLEE